MKATFHWSSPTIVLTEAPKQSDLTNLNDLLIILLKAVITCSDNDIRHIVRGPHINKVQYVK